MTIRTIMNTKVFYSFLNKTGSNNRKLTKLTRSVNTIITMNPGTTLLDETNKYLIEKKKA